MEEQERRYISHTRLTLGDGWHDGYVIYADGGHHLPIGIGLTMEGCLSLQAECARLAEFDPDLYETLAFDASDRTWHLTNVEDGEVEVDEPFEEDGVELWHIGHWLGYGWEAEDWAKRPEAARA